MKHNHMLLMLIGCLLPLMLIFLAPLFGITGDWPLLLFIVAMFAVHLLMPMHHARLPDRQGGHGHHHTENRSETSKSNHHEHH